MRPLVLAWLLIAICACGAERATDSAARAPAASSTPTDTEGNDPLAPPAPPVADTPPPAPPTADTAPARFQGSYAADATACGSPAHESRLAIAEREIRLHESSGPITAVSATADAVTIEAMLSGEGETFERSFTYRLSQDGNTLTDASGGMTRQRCG